VQDSDALLIYLMGLGIDSISAREKLEMASGKPDAIQYYKINIINQ